MANKSKNQKLLQEFTEFCAANPELRFWQALCAWADLNIWAEVPGDGNKPTDVFYWTVKNPLV